MSSLSVLDTKKGCIKQGFIEGHWMAGAYRDKEPTKDLRVTINSVGLWGLTKRSGLGKVLL